MKFAQPIAITCTIILILTASLTPSATAPAGDNNSIGDVLPAVGSMETLLKLLDERGVFFDSKIMPPMTDDSADADVMLQISGEAPDGGQSNFSMAAEDAGGGGSHSRTNEQVEGVSEGDIVKTDGRYLYALSGSILRIIEVSGASMDVVSAIEFDDMWGAEFYLMGDKIAVVGQKHTHWDMPLTRGDGEITDLMWRGGRDTTVLTVYDIEDRGNPFMARRVEMDGWSVSTRVAGDVVYLFTNKHIWGVPYDFSDDRLILPCISDTETGDEDEPVSLERMFYLPGSDDTSYLIIGALDVNGGAFETTVYLGTGNTVYMSRDSLYISKTRWEPSGNADQWGRDRGMTVTDILRFAVNGTDVFYTGVGTVNGTPINQYSMDEYNGYFRIATTDWTEGTLVTVFNSDMRLVGQTEYMAPGEWMFSMRFMGDMGYVVTFEMVDPLFTIDLSNPYHPRVLGELKIPGFSQYLHPVGDGLLLGIGRDTQELFTRDRNGVETVVGFHDVGLKLSLFDVSNPFDPREIYVLPMGQGWTEAAHNPRALMVDAARGLYGFTFDSWGDNWNRHSASALIIRVDGGRISIAAGLDTGDSFQTWGSRLAFIGDTLYLTCYDGVYAYDYNTFQQLNSIKF